MDSRIVPFIDAFREAATAIDSPEFAAGLSDHPTERDLDLTQQLAATALIWSGRQLRAIALLLESGFDLEIEPLVRALLENAINVAWVGDDQDRARRHRDEGLGALRTWLKAMESEAPNLFSHEALERARLHIATSTGGTIPSLQDRVLEARPPGFKYGLLRRAYVFSYRRLSASVHGDNRLMNLIREEPDGTALMNARDAAIAGAITCASAAVPLRVTNLGFAVAKKLFTVAEASHGRTYSSG